MNGILQKKLYLFILLFVGYTAAAQNPSSLYKLVNDLRATNKHVEKFSLFQISGITPSATVGATLKELSILKLNADVASRLLKEKFSSISVDIPFRNGSVLTIELIQQDIIALNDFTSGTLTTNERAAINIDQGLHYRGYILGDQFSIACISIFQTGEVMGIFSNKDGNYNIGRNRDIAEQYILYNSNDLTVPLPFECATNESLQIADEVATKMESPLSTAVVPPLLCKKVRIYWEADYKLFANDFGSDTTDTQNYLTGLFNQVSTMYQNEGILIELTSLYIWIAPDPYTTNTSSAGLASFKSRWNGLSDTFKADLAVLIDGSPTNNGGIAYLLSNICNRTFAYGYANIYGSFNAVPVYSWDVEVVTHEMGHMMGSHHTHWCGWNTGAGGTCGAIDDCNTTESGGSCSSCAATTSTNPTAPAGFKGTVMSYCHLRSGIGISLANGFGTFPQTAIRNVVNAASCAIRDNKWTGAVSTAWEDTGNWGCGLIPDINTDVTISGGLPRYPIVNSAAVCRRLIQDPTTSLLVKTGFTLMIAGLPANP